MIRCNRRMLMVDRMKLLFPSETRSPERVILEDRQREDALRAYLEESRQKQAIERAMSNPVIATKVSMLQHRRALAQVRADSLMEMAGTEGRVFTHAEGRLFDQSFAEMEQIDRELRALTRE
jgi:hypothetical protein